MPDGRPATRRVRHFRAAASRIAIYTHRWLGISLGAFFIAWFVSGIVLMYAGMPRLTPAEALARTPPLDFSTAVVSVATAAAAVGGHVDAAALGMHLGRPVYRLRAAARTASVFADDGTPVETVTRDQALDIVRAFAPEAAAHVSYDGYVATPDQWTLEINRQLPMHRIALGDPAATRLYVSAATGAVVLKTTASTRRWAYPGAILHWVYFTPIRRHAEGWEQFIIWTSVAGTAMSLVGLAWGVWRYSPRRRYRLKREPSRSPYAGWMWWHHYGGLLFGVVTTTWVFSGLLSMDPWDWHPSTQPTQAQRLALSGGAFDVSRVSAGRIRDVLAQQSGARQASVVQSRGQLYLATDRGVVSLEPGVTPGLPLDGARIAALARAAMPDTPIGEVTRLDRYDAYYYDRNNELPLPVWRIEYGDAVHTWLYVDAARGSAVRKEERLTRVNRWLYHGLHSLDFPVLYYRRPLWDIAVIVLSLGGLALTLTTLAPAWHRIARHIRRLR